VAALVPVIENAGGIATDWKGERLGDTEVYNFIAAGDRRVHEEAVKLLNAK
jgi:fructose-1,6-bisphosphatase/inositol monophosphatase family enzyme